MEQAFIYQMGQPMGFGWDRLPTIADHVQSLMAPEYPLTRAGDVQHALAQARRFGAWADAALTAARERAGWDGDFRSGSELRVFYIPDDSDGLASALVWKQDNNGTTFVASPFRLPWLGEPAAQFAAPAA
jgi:hypothetical protein